MPTQAGDNLDYTNIEKKVFTLLFEKGLDQLTDDFLLTKFRKNRVQLKNHILQVLVDKAGAFYKAKNESTMNQLRQIQKICHQNPQIHRLTEETLFREIKMCLAMLVTEARIQLDLTTLNAVRNNLLICFLEIIQSCIIKLHDGREAHGFISVGSNNTLYDRNPSVTNLNLCFTVTVPIEQSFAIIELIQTGLTVGKHVHNPESVIEWLNHKHTFGRLNAFRLGKAEMVVPK
jgi:hypothetical protein